MSHQKRPNLKAGQSGGGLGNQKKTLSKQLLKSYMNTGCERQLLLAIGEGSSEWMKPLVPLVPAKSIPYHVKKLAQFGHDYEQEIYKILALHPFTKYTLNKNNNIDKVQLTGSLLRALHKKIMGAGSPTTIFLLEHEYNSPESFLRTIFPKKNNSSTTLPIKPSSHRPDIILLKKHDTQDVVFELTTNGEERRVPAAELGTRIGVGVVDIKHIMSESIAKKEFTEILYYLISFTYFLQDNNLKNLFFVDMTFNGILPHIEDLNTFVINAPVDIEQFVIPVDWNEFKYVLTTVLEKLKQLWLRAPIPIEDTEQRIQPQCGYCSFFDDCKARLGANGTKPPKDWSLKLIPYTSMSIAQQLINLGFKTVGDVESRIKGVKVGVTPEPIYPELPLLDLKARALVNGKEFFPLPGTVHSYSLPRFSPMALSFCAEDTQDDRIFGVGLYLSISVPANSLYSDIFDKWCEIWDDAIKNSMKPHDIKKQIDLELIKGIEIDEVKNYLKSIRILNGITIIVPGTVINGKSIPHGRIKYNFTRINDGLEEKNEITLVKGFISRLHAVLTFCNIIESHVVVESRWPGFFIGPDLGIFYWSGEQLDNIQKMLERHLKELVNDPAIRLQFFEIVSWFTPSDSEVVHPYQHKKLFDLRKFVETVLGFPAIINYTWHGIWKKKRNINISPLYWRENFNYMDFQAWYEYLDVAKNNPAKGASAKKKLEMQILYKMRAINALRLDYQIHARSLLSSNSRAISNPRYQNAVISENYHAIAHFWYMFSKLNATTQELETETFRTTYPEFSIGKLAAAEVTNLQPISTDPTHWFHKFHILGLSSNMKVSEGDYLFLIPDEKRDMPVNARSRKWMVVVDTITWDSNAGGYQLTTEVSTNNLFLEYQNEFPMQDPQKTKWYLYPTSMDAWSRKLYFISTKADALPGLLQKFNFGSSWLGSCLSYEWDIGIDPKFKLPAIWLFSSQETYLYAPALLKNLKTSMKPLKRLLTTMKFPPDTSQSAAINQALHNVIFGIQGPPGTGKSQTIAALIDEYLLRSRMMSNAPVRILVTAFSYSALRVVIDKVRESTDANGMPTAAARMQLLFLRSQSQEPVADKPGCRHVDDLLRKGGTWKLNLTPKTVTKRHLLEESLEDDYIIFANAHQLFYLVERVEEESFHFDLIIVDEASQVPLDHFMSSLQFIKPYTFSINPHLPPGQPGKKIENINEIVPLSLKETINPDMLTRVVIVGDYNQLPPVQPIKPPKNLESILGSLFSYYVRNHKIPNKQLEVNYRSHEDIVKFTNEMGIYENLTASPGNATKTIQGNLNNVGKTWVREVLEPSRVVSCIIHDRQYELSVSPFEATLVTKIIIGYFDMVNPLTVDDQVRFWKVQVGIVAPHNAQGRLIIHDVFEQMTEGPSPRNILSPRNLMKLLKGTIYSVEKFQGSDRDVIIASIGVSDKDQLGAEEEFIYDLNRFNVLTSRAKSKVVMVCSESFLRNIPHDRDVMNHASKVRKYAFTYCNCEKLLIPLNENQTRELIRFRWKGKCQAHANTGASNSRNVQMTIKVDKFEITLPDDKRVLEIFQSIPDSIEKTLVRKENGPDSWEFRISDVPRIKQYLPLSRAVLQAYIDLPAMQQGKESTNGTGGRSPGKREEKGGGDAGGNKNSDGDEGGKAGESSEDEFDGMNDDLF
ncbi:MAG: DEAD/DEAH box helicase [Promethearchaeota archaeon]